MRPSRSLSGTNGRTETEKVSVDVITWSDTARAHGTALNAGGAGTPASLRSLMYAPASTTPRLAPRIAAPRLRLVEHKRSRIQRMRDRQRRVLNVLVAGVGIVLTMPFMLVIALAVKLTSPGPVLYTQNRVGLDKRTRRGPGSTNGRRRDDRGGRIFRIYKFRSMTVDTSGGEVWATANDPRITPVGEFLRKYRLDELPQLFNVLKGDMNIVGPRPEQPEIFRELKQKVDGYGRRQRVLPGITGWAQVNHHYDQCIDDVKRKVDLDLEYMRRRSAAEDFKIMARTVPVMVGKKGAI